jgi:hypothetical protein
MSDQSTTLLCARAHRYTVRQPGAAPPVPYAGLDRDAAVSALRAAPFGLYTSVRAAHVDDSSGCPAESLCVDADGQRETRWCGLRGPFVCSRCGARVLYDSGGPSQTLNGTQKLCRDCTRHREEIGWAALPAGVYEVRVLEHTGAVVASTRVRKGA